MDNELSSPFDSKDFVTSLSRGLAVIQAFDKNAPKLTLTEVAKRTELNRAAARRFLFTLNALGYVETDGKLFWLGPKILELGYAYLASQPIVDIVQPYIDEVSKATGESCSVSVIDGNDVVYIARHLTHHVMSVTLNVGTRLPAFVTSMGRAMLAFRPDDEVNQILKNSQLKKFTEFTIVDRNLIKEELIKVKQQGFAVVNQELDFGLRSIAVPIFNKRGLCVAAMNVSTHAGRLSDDCLFNTILPSLQHAADEVSKVLPA